MQKKRSILIVDDKKINLIILNDILQTEYNVYSAETGKDALSIVRHHGSALSAIMLDIIMPEMDGFEFLQILKDEKVSVPIIVTTQLNDEQSEIKALSLGATDFVAKPYKPFIIKQRIANLITLKESSSLINKMERDELTGVYTKEFFYKLADEAMYRTDISNYCIICADVENFKLVNDLLGERVGDDFLQFLAQTIQTNLNNDEFCGRLFADIFVIFISFRKFKAAIEKITETIRAYSKKISININFGVYQIDIKNDISVPIMCDRAKLALQEIKGKYDVHYQIYNDNIRKKLLDEKTITNYMRSAINEKQFVVYYQPKYDLLNDELVGAEALVRWIHPTYGFIPPDRFITIFEKNGFIFDLDKYVWTSVCETIREYDRKGIKFPPVSVNVSRTDLYNPMLPKIITNLIKSYEITPDRFHIEITETAYTENPKQIVQVIKKLKALGFLIEMDDFGKGYSSLNMISELPIDVLKIDTNLVQNKKNHGILSFIISLARWLDLIVIAEGVETFEQVQVLKNMDCNYVQGYYYSKPVPINEFDKLLKKFDIGIMKKKTYINEQSVNMKIINDKERQIMLIVDDIQMNRKILAYSFKDNFSIVEAENGHFAYNFIKKNHKNISIILLDIIMPEMDGFQLIERIREDVDISDIPIIITSQLDSLLESRVLSMGVYDFISKPYNTDVAKRRVENVLAYTKLHQLNAATASKKELFKVAYHDYLTDLFNRRGFESAYNAGFEPVKDAVHAIFLIDIDNFKKANDTLGHGYGDSMLKQFSKILKSSFRNNDAICRFGGDEFAVLTRNLPSAEFAEKKAKHVCAEIERFGKTQEIPVTCSVGVVTFAEDGDLYRLIDKADSAMYKAKNAGKNKFSLYTEI